MNRRAACWRRAGVAGPAAIANSIAILFVGNSYTFCRVDPVLSYNAANVHDLTAAFKPPARPGRTVRAASLGRRAGTL